MFPHVHSHFLSCPLPGVKKYYLRGRQIIPVATMSSFCDFLFDINVSYHRYSDWVKEQAPNGKGCHRQKTTTTQSFEVTQQATAL